MSLYKLMPDDWDDHAGWDRYYEAALHKTIQSLTHDLSTLTNNHYQLSDQQRTILAKIL